MIEDLEEGDRLWRLGEFCLGSIEEVLATHLLKALRALWAAAFPEEKLHILISEQWKEMGWQGKDPSTDFRGGGFTSLKNLIYFAGNYSAFDVLTRSIKYQFHDKTETPQLKAGDTSNNSKTDEVKKRKSEDLLKEQFSRKNTKENRRHREGLCHIPN